MGITTFSRNQNWGKTDWSRPSYSTTSTTITDEAKEQEPQVHISQPRFSVFGKKAKFTEINKKSLEQDKAAIEANKATETNTNAASTASVVKRNKFELHLSSKSSANYKFSQSAPPSPSITPTKSTSTSSSLSITKKRVSFDPVFLERVCLFREAQSPCELKQAHDKRLQNPPFRISCSHWPPQETSDYYAKKNILLNKKSFSVTPDNAAIKGKLMVRNLALDKSVTIRYTFDSWTTTVRDVDAVFFGPNPKNIAFDIYEFAIDLDYGQLADRGELRGKLEFAIRFTAAEKDYCDNNNGSNYQIKIISDPLNDPWADEIKQQKEKEKTDQVNDDGEEVEEEEEEEEELEEELEEVEEQKHSQFTNALKGYKHAKPFHLNKPQPWLGTRYDFGQSLSLAKRAPYESWSATVKANPSLITDYFLVKPITIKPSEEPIQFPSQSNNKMTKSSSTTTSTMALKSFTPYHLTSTSSSTAPSYSKPLYVTSSASAPPSPRISPTLPSESLPVRPALYHHSLSTSSATLLQSTDMSPLDINSSYYLDLVNKYCFYSGSPKENNNDSEFAKQLSISSTT
jgi:hypothetical protein